MLKNKNSVSCSLLASESAIFDLKATEEGKGKNCNFSLFLNAFPQIISSNPMALEDLEYSMRHPYFFLCPFWSLTDMVTMNCHFMKKLHKILH